MTTTESTDTLDVIVVGGGQAGLAIAYHLKRQGARFLVLDAGSEVGESWRTRWDSLRLFTPAQYDALPGMPFRARLDAYPTKDMVAGGFVAHTCHGLLRARQVVIATGPFQELAATHEVESRLARRMRDRSDLVIGTPLRRLGRAG